MHRVAQLTILMYVLRGGDGDGGRDGDNDEELSISHTQATLAEARLQDCETVF